MTTGMRPGELRALKWVNYDEVNQTIRITNAITKDIKQEKIGEKPKSKKEIVGSTKSDYGVRTLQLSDEAIYALTAWRKYIDTTDKYQFATGSEYIFTGRNSSFLLESALISRFKRFLKAEQFENRGFTFYRFRHTLCTVLVRSSVDVGTIQRIMGDNTTDVIFKIYTHINDSDTSIASKKAFVFMSNMTSTAIVNEV